MSEHPDPYLWLESLDSPEACAWVERQNALCAARLDADPRFALLQRAILDNLRDTRQIPFINQYGDWLYNFHQSAEQPRGIYRRTRLDSYRAQQGEWEGVLDLDELAADQQQDWYLAGISHATLHPERCLLSLSPGGSDAAVTLEYDVEARALVADGFQFPLGKNQLAWRDLNSVFVCPAWEGADCTRSGYPREVWLLERGQPWSAARRLFRADEAAMMVAAWRFLSPDGPALDLIECSDSFYRKRYYLLDDALSATALPLPAEADVLAWFHGELIVLLHQDWTVNGLPLRAGSLVTWHMASGQAARLFEPEAGASVESVECSRDFVLVNLLENVVSRLLAFQRQDGQWQQRRLSVPGEGVVELCDLPWDTNSVYFSYSDFLTPAGLYRLTLPDGVAECLRAQPAAFDASAFVVEQRRARAPDGTAIPYFVVRQQHLAFDGNAPTLLYGYGGFQVPMLPYYMENFGQHWLEKGGVFVLANIRGGGEFGPAWHQAAKGIKRSVSFDDFIAVAEDLIACGLTRPAKLAIEGGSNGGLLVGAAMVRRPELFQAVVCEVPLLDMLRFPQWLAGASWIDEYGDPDDASQRPWLAAYSPYHQLRAGVRYPAALFTTSRQDDRVHPAHARKMVARLLDGGAEPLFCETVSGGHSGQTDQQQTATDLARVLVFLYQQLFD